MFNFVIAKYASLESVAAEPPVGKVVRVILTLRARMIIKLKLWLDIHSTIPYSKMPRFEESERNARYPPKGLK